MSEASRQRAPSQTIQHPHFSINRRFSPNRSRNASALPASVRCYREKSIPDFGAGSAASLRTAANGPNGSIHPFSFAR